MSSRDSVPSAVALALDPLISAYSTSLSAAQASQQSLQARLTAVLSELRTAQQGADDAEVARISGAASRVETLRRRLEAVAAMMGRVQARLEALQGAVAKKEAEAKGRG